MNTTASHRRDPATPPRHHADDWEEWEDDEMITPIDAGEQVLMQSSEPTATTSRSTKRSSTRATKLPSSRISRLKSRRRQQAQNAKAGIRLITDIASLRRQNHIANQMRTADGRPVKFVDAAALQALEGEPNSASVGNWNWLKKKNLSPSSAKTPLSGRNLDQGLSPQDRPIVIGISLASDDAEGREISPQTATVHDIYTPVTAPKNSKAPATETSTPIATSSSSGANQHKSVWSPDTPDTVCSFNSYRPASSVYSQVTVPGLVVTKDVPPVPDLPANYKKTPRQKLISLELGGGPVDEDDTGTPCTLFEEDGISSPQKSAGAKTPAITPDSASSRSYGWWDHVVTPFVDKTMSFSSRRQKLESPNEKAEQEWWKLSNNKENQAQVPNLQPSRMLVQPPIVRAPTPRRSPSLRTIVPGDSISQVSSTRSSPPLEDRPIGEKPRIIVTADIPADQPPPYSPPKKQVGAAPVRYRAVFPPGHALQAQFPPSPGPASPGLAGTMTSQGATQMMEIPITAATRSPSPLSTRPLLNRPVGASLPERYEHSASGRDHRVERERRRHEKEEVIARRVGGFWRGRGCMPKNGCFGRTGPEGRKRRRVCMAVWGSIIALLILIIVLAVVLTRPHDSPPVHSIWVNLTDFPPMPTGVLTVVGPDNTAARSGCTEPSTMWSCALPKDQHDSVAPYKPNQPTVIMQIQWDNSTAEGWKVPNGDVPQAVSRRAGGAASHARSVIRERQTDGFKSNPSPPDFQEMWFLGETTDDIASNQKAGEPAPFYISVIPSVNHTVDTPRLGRRKGPDVGTTPLSDIIPAPVLEADGTPAPAVMLPEPVQQPVRLYDRGLPTEHYGFYTHFQRSLYLKSVTILNNTKDGDIPLDEDGGCSKSEANFLTAWAETRMLVQIWTRTLDLNTSSLLKPDGSKGINGTAALIRPGTMPYPVTVTLDTHGGDPSKKVVWEWPMDNRQQIDVDKAKLLANNMGVGGTWINPRGSGDKKFGGFDGGTGGCKCEWVNWVADLST